MCLAVEVQPADYSTAEVQQPQNFYRLAVSVSEGLRTSVSVPTSQIRDELVVLRQVRRGETVKRLVHQHYVKMTQTKITVFADG